MIMLKQLSALGLFVAVAQAAVPPEPTTTTFNTPAAISNGYDLFATTTPTVPTTPTSGVFPPTTVTTTFCPTSRSHHTRPHKPTRHHDHCHDRRDRCHDRHERPCCKTTSYTTCIEQKTCCIYVYPCPTNTTSVITSTSYVQCPAPAPTQQVAPTREAAPVCTPCTSYVTETVRPSLVCTTMIFCDVADQSENCRLQNEMKIEEIASLALREGGQVFVNGQLVVFENSGRGSGSGATTVVSGTSSLTVTGQKANDAPAIAGSGVVGALALLAGIMMFA